MRIYILIKTVCEYVLYIFVEGKFMKRGRVEKDPANLTWGGKTTLVVRPKKSDTWLIQQLNL